MKWRNSYSNRLFCVTIRHHHWHTRHSDSRDTAHTMDEWNSEMRRSRWSHHPFTHWLVLGLVQKRHSLHWEMNKGITLSPEIQTQSCQMMSNTNNKLWKQYIKWATCFLAEWHQYNYLQWYTISTHYYIYKGKHSCQTNCWGCNL